MARSVKARNSGEIDGMVARVEGQFLKTSNRLDSVETDIYQMTQMLMTLFKVMNDILEMLNEITGGEDDQIQG